MTDFFVHFDRIAPAANKYMATLYNLTGTKIIEIDEIFAYNAQSIAVVGILLEQYITFILNRTVGTIVPIYQAGRISLPNGIQADTNSAAVQERAIVRRFFKFGEEHPVIGTAAPPINVLEQHDAAMQCIYRKPCGSNGLSLLSGNGISIRNVTASIVGSVSYLIYFSLKERAL